MTDVIRAVALATQAPCLFPAIGADHAGHLFTHTGRPVPVNRKPRSTRMRPPGSRERPSQGKNK